MCSFSSTVCAVWAECAEDRSAIGTRSCGRATVLDRAGLSLGPECSSEKLAFSPRPSVITAKAREFTTTSIPQQSKHSAANEGEQVSVDRRKLE